MNPHPWHILTLPHLYEIAGILLVLCGALWLVHWRVGNASLADVGFCVGFGFVVIVCGMAGEGSPWRRILVVGMGVPMPAGWAGTCGGVEFGGRRKITGIEGFGRC